MSGLQDIGYRPRGRTPIEDTEDEIALALATLLLLHPEWFEAFPSVLDNKMRAAIHGVFGELLEDDGDAAETLKTSSLSDKAKWQALGMGNIGSALFGGIPSTGTVLLRECVAESECLGYGNHITCRMQEQD